MGKLRRIFFGSDELSAQQPYGGTEAAQFKLEASDWPSRLWYIAKAARDYTDSADSMFHLLTEVCACVLC